MSRARDCYDCLDALCPFPYQGTKAEPSLESIVLILSHPHDEVVVVEQIASFSILTDGLGWADLVDTTSKASARR